MTQPTTESPANDDDVLEDDSGDWECGQCHGSGDGLYDGSVCMACRGTGGSY